MFGGLQLYRFLPLLLIHPNYTPSRFPISLKFRLDQLASDETFEIEPGWISSPEEYEIFETESHSVLEVKFRRLAKEWKEATRFMSSATDMILHPAYQTIIGMGSMVVPLILRELKLNGGHWFSALMAITEKNPVSGDDYGHVSRMAAAWIEWGRRHRLI